MTYPIAPAPRTWSPGDLITSPRLRADPGNLAWLLTRRPLFMGAQLTTGQSVSAVTPVSLDSEYEDNWSGHTEPSPYYQAPLSGWYLAEGQISLPLASAASVIAAGIRYGSTGHTDLLCSTQTSNTVNAPGPAACDLVSLNTATSDVVALTAYTNSGAGPVIAQPGAWFKAEWAALNSGGTVISSPQPAAAWPPGAGTTITNSGGIAAGATSMTVAAATGIVVGATLGLDYFEGAAVQPYAEKVTVTSVAGTTIGISATAYAHLQTAPVAVPVSAAWMNQQVRDVIRFLAYPPFARLSASTSAQTLPTQTFPAGTAISFTSATADNFGGWSSGTPTVWTVPVSGVYFVYGQVPLSSTAAWNNLSAGVSVSGGTITWGDSLRSQTAQVGCATFRGHLRLTAGQTLALYGSQSSAAAQPVVDGSDWYPTLVALWRGF